MGASAALRFTERGVLFLVAVSFVRSEHTRAVAIGVGLAALYAVHGALRASLRKRVYARLVGTVVRALVVTRAVGTSDAAPEDEQQSVFEGLFRSESLLSEHIPELVANSAASAALVLLLARLESSRLLALGAIALVAAALAASAVRRLVTRTEERARKAFVPVVDAVVAAVRGRVELSASGRGATFAARTDALSDHWRRVSSRGDRIASLAGRTPVLAAGLAVGLVVLIVRASGGRVDAHALGDAAVVASIVPAFAGAARALVEVSRATTQLAPLHALLASAVPDPPGGLLLAGTPARVAVEAVTFRYGDGERTRAVLDGLSFTWERGTPLVIAGPNGAGKSTLLRLLLGLAQPTLGAVRIDGVDLAKLDVSAWRQSVAYLAQRPYLSERASVRETVRVFSLDVSDEVIAAALVRTGIFAALEELSPADPLGIRIGVLSVGQRQRVALARVLCHDAPVVVLDEPDANLDAAGIRLVAALVRELSATRMVAVVAHTNELLDAGDAVLRLGGS